MMITEYLLVFFTIFVASVFFVGSWKWKKQPNHRFPPSLPTLPLIGSLPFLRGFDHIAIFFMEKSRQLGPIFTFRAGRKLVLVLNNKDAIEEALVKNSRSFSSRPQFFMQKLINPETKGIIFKDNTPEFKRIHQNCLTVLREFGFGNKSIMEEKILREVEEMVEYGRNTDGKAFDPNELFFLAASNVQMNILFGSRRSYDLGISELIHEVERLGHLMDMIFDVVPFLKFVPPFKGKIPAIQSCQMILNNLIPTEIDRSVENQNKCFVSRYIDKEGPNYDRDNLNFLLRDLFAAGTDTTATAMRWAMVVFANHLEIQKKLQEEIDSVIPRDRFPSLQDQTKLPYVQATIHELYRWRTLVPLSVAHLAIHDSIVMDYFIPAGTLVLPNLHSVHNDSAVWIDPEVFRPERFLDKENNVVGTDRIIPFSLGRRSCLGEVLARAEIFLILTSFLQRFTVYPPEGQDKVCDEPLKPVMIVHAPKPYSIRLMERN